MHRYLWIKNYNTSQHHLIVLGICVALKALNTMKRDDLKLVANYHIHENYVTKFLFINVRFNNKKGFYL